MIDFRNLTPAALLLFTAAYTTPPGAAERCLDALGDDLASVTQRGIIEIEHPPGKNDCDHYVVITSDGIQGASSYTIEAGRKLFQVEGKLDGYEVTTDSHDSTRARTGSGRVSNGTDGFLVWGEIERIELDSPGAARIYVDGTRYSAGATSGADNHTVVIDGGGGSGATGYTLVAGERVEPVEGRLGDHKVTIGRNDSVRDNRAQGRVTSGADGFRVYGGLQSLELASPAAAKVYIDSHSAPEAVADLGRDIGGALGGNDSNRPTGGGNRVPGENSGGGLFDFADKLGGGNAFAGTWSTNFDELRLHRVGEFLIGDYADQGVMLGRVSGNCAAGVFTNGARNGKFRLELNDKGAFRGTWAWHGEQLDGNWQGERTGPPPRQLQNFARNGSTQTVEQQRSVYDGRYNSNHGELTLMSRHLFLVGDYADRGILAGMWDGNSFVGHFTNGSRTGWFDFVFFSKNGSFRNGEWGWFGEGGGGEWNLSRVSDQSSPKIDNVTRNVSCR